MTSAIPSSESEAETSFLPCANCTFLIEPFEGGAENGPEYGGGAGAGGGDAGSGSGHDGGADGSSRGGGA
jgi:hypothetical protein